ncbi:MAG: hypothetical protein LBH98_06485 [Chitinispirillales bacterium]|nr:hypothetical protein [Chitinispirillales bacterium]
MVKKVCSFFLFIVLSVSSQDYEDVLPIIGGDFKYENLQYFKQRAMKYESFRYFQELYLEAERDLGKEQPTNRIGSIFKCEISYKNMVEIILFIAEELGENAQELRKGAANAGIKLRTDFNKSVNSECAKWSNALLVNAETYKTEKRKDIESNYKNIEKKLFSCLKKNVLK